MNDINSTESVITQPKAGVFYKSLGDAGYFMLCHLSDSDSTETATWLAFPARHLRSTEVESDNTVIVDFNTPTHEVTVNKTEAEVVNACHLRESEMQPSADTLNIAFATAVKNRHTYGVGQYQRAEQFVSRYHNVCREHEEWKEQLTEDLHEQANNGVNGSGRFCSDFDRFMEDHGMRGRSQDYTVGVRVYFDVNVSINAESESEARNEVTDEMVADAMRDESWQDWDIHSVELDD